MAKCKQCDCDIKRGTTYHGEKFKTLSFCSEECYNRYVAEQERDKKFYRQLTDYIVSIWQGEEPYWPFLTKQIKSWKEDYKLDNRGILLVLKYAVEYENYQVDPQYGLMQFLKFITPAQEFADAIERNKEAAENMPDEVVVKIKPRKQRRWIKEEDWDDD